ncbi:MAG TPA: hypothetical protein VK453_25790 [Micromonosporaceae bacterium]|nr:hypothetical protein [Micromonosporaceae bacterium]
MPDLPEPTPEAVELQRHIRQRVHVIWPLGPREQWLWQQVKVNRLAPRRKPSGPSS